MKKTIGNLIKVFFLVTVTFVVLWGIAFLGDEFAMHKSVTTVCMIAISAVSVLIYFIITKNFAATILVPTTVIISASLMLTLIHFLISKNAIEWGISVKIHLLAQQIPYASFIIAMGVDLVRQRRIEK